MRPVSAKWCIPLFCAVALFLIANLKAITCRAVVESMVNGYAGCHTLAHASLNHPNRDCAALYAVPTCDRLLISSEYDSPPVISKW